MQLCRPPLPLLLGRRSCACSGWGSPEAFLSRTGRAFQRAEILVVPPGLAKAGFVLRGALARALVCAGKAKPALRVSQMVMIAFLGCLCVQEIRAILLAATATCSRLPFMLRFFANVASLSSFLENVPFVFDAFRKFLAVRQVFCFVLLSFRVVFRLCLEASPPAACVLGCWKPLRSWKPSPFPRTEGVASLLGRPCVTGASPCAGCQGHGGC